MCAYVYAYALFLYMLFSVLFVVFMGKLYISHKKSYGSA